MIQTINQEHHHLRCCQADTGLEMETIEILKKTYDDFEKRHSEEEDGVSAWSLARLNIETSLNCLTSRTTNNLIFCHNLNTIKEESFIP